MSGFRFRLPGVLESIACLLLGVTPWFGYLTSGVGGWLAIVAMTIGSVCFVVGVAGLGAAFRQRRTAGVWRV